MRILEPCRINQPCAGPSPALGRGGPRSIEFLQKQQVSSLYSVNLIRCLVESTEDHNLFLLVAGTRRALDPIRRSNSLDDIAGICDETGKILGLMPHPERAQFFHQLPHWTYLKEKMERAGKKLPSVGPGLQIFRNAVNYFHS